MPKVTQCELVCTRYCEQTSGRDQLILRLTAQVNVEDQFSCSEIVPGVARRCVERGGGRAPYGGVSGCSTSSVMRVPIAGVRKNYAHRRADLRRCVGWR